MKHSSLKSSSRILLLADAAGSGPFYHLGDEALAEVALVRLKTIVSAENITMVCSRPETAGPAYGVKAIRLPRHSRHGWWLNLLRHPIRSARELFVLLQHLHRSQLVFVSGGGNLSAVWQTTLESRIFLLRLARLLQKPVVLAGQTFGPFNPRQRLRIQKILRYNAWIGVRDRHFSTTQLGLSTHYHPDDAIFLRPDRSGIPQQFIQSNRPLFLISLRSYRLFKASDYQQLFQAIRELVIAHDARPVFLPHYAPYGRDDLQIAATIQSEWSGDPLLEVIAPVPPARTALALTATCNLIITSRYHAAIFGLTAGVPVVAIYGDPYTEAKFRGAFEQFELNPILFKLGDPAATLKQLAEQAGTTRPQILKAAQRMQKDQLAVSLAPYQLVAKLLD